MAVGAKAAGTVQAKQPAVPTLKPLGALGVDEGVFVLLAVPASFEPVESFARYVEEPLPHLVSATSGSWLKRQGFGSVTVYVGFVPWPHAPVGVVKLGCSTASGRKPVFSVKCSRWNATEPAQLAALFKSYGALLMPAIEAVLPISHPLRISLSPKTPAPATAPASTAARTMPVVRGNFDGVVDEQAHGWAWCPSESDRRLTVEVLCGEEVVARGTADHFRADLQANNIGDGNHHFRLALSIELFDGKPYELSVRVVETGTILTGRITATLPQRQPLHLDALPRADLLKFAGQLARRMQIREPKALHSMLQAFRQASLMQETGLLEQARAGYERLASILGNNGLCHCKIAETWLVEYRLEAAQEAYQAALKVDPTMGWAHLGLGNVLRLLGRPIEAETAYRVASKLMPDSAVVKRRLTAIYCDALQARAVQIEEAGDRASAIEMLRAVVIEQPDNDDACSLLDDWTRDGGSQDSDAFLHACDLIQQAARSKRLLDAVIEEAERRLKMTESV